TTLNLHAAALDPTKGREALAFAVFRVAGVPAPRTAFAEVTLTVPGKFDKEYLGLYIVVEPVDKAFLKEHFKTGRGLLMNPGREGRRAPPRRGLGKVKGPVPAAVRADQGGGPPRHRVRQTDQPGRRRTVPQRGRLVPRRGRVPALHGRQRLAFEHGELLHAG